MKPLMRYGVNKAKSSGQFRRNSRKTKSINLNAGLARGGIRL